MNNGFNMGMNAASAMNMNNPYNFTMEQYNFMFAMQKQMVFLSCPMPLLACCSTTCIMGMCFINGFPLHDPKFSFDAFSSCEHPW